MTFLVVGRKFEAIKNTSTWCRYDGLTHSIKLKQPTTKKKTNELWRDAADTWKYELPSKPVTVLRWNGEFADCCGYHFGTKSISKFDCWSKIANPNRISSRDSVFLTSIHNSHIIRIMSVLHVRDFLRMTKKYEPVPVEISRYLSRMWVGKIENTPK